MHIISEIITGGAGIVKLLNGARNLLHSLREHEKNELIAALRAIYFVPGNVRLLLADRAEGKDISHDRIDRAEVRFFGSERDVGSALSAILHRLDGNGSDLALLDSKLLTQIQWGKINLRQELLGLFDGKKFKLSPDEARQMLERVDKLNETIELLEDRLRANR